MNSFLILAAILLSSIVFIACSFLAIVCGAWLKVGGDFQEDNLPQTGFGFRKIVSLLLSDYLFEFLAPLAIFILLFNLLPLANVRSAIIFALIVFTFNASQMLLLSLQKIPIPFDFAVFTLFWKLVKYLVSFAVVGFILSI